MVNKILLILVFVWSGVQSASAETEKRIQFAKGKSSAVVEGETGTYGVTYTLRANAGQRVILTLSPEDKVGIKVEKEGSFGHEVLLREERGGTFEVYLEESGDISIFLGSTVGKSISYSLTVEIPKSRIKDI